MDDLSPAARVYFPWVRGRIAVGTAVAACLAFCLLLVSPVEAQNAARSLSGAWWITSYSPQLPLVGGGALPLNADGRAAYDRNKARLQDASLYDEARRICVPDGVPRILGNPYPFMIMQTPGLTTIIYELNHVIRLVRMDQPQENQEQLRLAPYYSGHSVGHWEGDTLVLETAGFNEKTFIDATGAPHSSRMTTVERYRKTNSGQLEVVVTVTDPVYYTQAFSARFVYDSRPGLRLKDYVCGEPHRDISHIPGVADARRNVHPFTP
jgi:hypothetical protein